MKQTAVEWLVERLLVDCVPLTQRDIDKAKQIEKEQIVHAYNYTVLNLRTKDGEQYYNETYKNTKDEPTI